MDHPEESAPGDPFKTRKPSAGEAAPPPHLPPRIGRYRTVRVLGEGSFGRVYLAHDDTLHRSVAIKVPHARLVTRPEDAEPYLTEARTVAALDHPNIVPVYDVGSSDDFPCFVVSKFIEGSTLARKIKENRPSLAEAVDLVATVADALAYAHRKGLVHRDVKPGNILLGVGGKPYVADFGLALKEADLGRGPRSAGTPAYMSPEQARGEGHRVDGRSDIFSLGVVFYELMTGRRPFHADSVDELMEQIKTLEVRPPRQWDDAIPKELERICLKALSKRATERYTTARDMVDDLRHFSEQSTDAGEQGPHTRTPPTPLPSSDSASTPGPDPAPATPSDSGPVKVVPKGLRSFDAHDADFFLELLPGPRDRAVLPDGVRFWKTRIEETDPDQTFSVGLMYGPSGCGKSSLVMAGLVPRLAGQVRAVYVEAMAEETEARLLRGLRKHCPALPADAGLAEAVSALRQGRGLPKGQKVLIVLDQFEQWLHANRAEEGAELVQALRQCDGGRVQCVVMVRDDFWMAATRFMQALEVRLVEGHNSAAVDLFDPRHARKVLTAFGRALAALPEHPGELSREQATFLDQAVTGLAREGKVIPVRLALFAEMVKGKPWTPATLKAVGGTAGLGIAFLEETFSTATAPPEHRRHQRAARTVLKALLPEQGSAIKGTLRSREELLAASGYGTRLQDFDAVLRLLDGELRLITPTDPEGAEDSPRSPGDRYYQLTHDYLVPSLRDWLTHKQKETRRGRAELLLADRTSVWNTRPENRQLPSLWEWLEIGWQTRHTSWSSPQRAMMFQATRYYLLRSLVALLATASVVLAVVVVQYHLTEPLRIRDELATVKGVNVQRLEEGNVPADWVGKWRVRVDAGYYRHSSDNWGRGQFGTTQLEAIAPKLVRFPDLVWMDLTELESLERAMLHDLEDVRQLEFDNCRKLNLVELRNLPKLKDLRLSSCYELVQVIGLGELPNLEALSLTPNWPTKKTNPREITGLKDLPKLKNLKFLGWRDVSSLDELYECAAHLSNVEEIDIGLHPSGIRSLRNGEIKDFKLLKQFGQLKTIYVHGLSRAELKQLTEDLGLSEVKMNQAYYWENETWKGDAKVLQDKNKLVISVFNKPSEAQLRLIHNEPTAVRPPTAVFQP